MIDCSCAASKPTSTILRVPSQTLVGTRNVTATVTALRALSSKSVVATMAQSTASLLVAAAAAGAAAAYLVCQALASKAPVAGEAAIAARVQEAVNALVRAPTAAAKTFPVIAKPAKQKRAFGSSLALCFVLGALPSLFPRLAI